MSKKQNTEFTDVRVYVKMSCFAYLMPSNGKVTRAMVEEEVRRMLTNPESLLWDSIFDEMVVSGITNYKSGESIEIDLT